MTRLGLCRLNPNQVTATPAMIAASPAQPHWLRTVCGLPRNQPRAVTSSYSRFWVALRSEAKVFLRSESRTSLRPLKIACMSAIS